MKIRSPSRSTVLVISIAALFAVAGMFVDLYWVWNEREPNLPADVDLYYEHSVGIHEGWLIYEMRDDLVAPASGFKFDVHGVKFELPFIAFGWQDHAVIGTAPWFVSVVVLGGYFLFSISKRAQQAEDARDAKRSPENESDGDQQVAQRLWVVEQRNLWGDYGDVLISGYGRREKDDSPILLHRTGPFLPPISFPWISNAGGHAVIVSDDFRSELIAMKLPGVAFREAIKSRIVPLPWHQWDASAANPAVRPPEGEPENYIWDEKHDAACAVAMPAAFELVPPVGPIRIDRVEDPRGGYVDEFVTESDAKDVPPISRSHRKLGYGYVIVDDGMRAWLEKHVGSWVRFSPIRVQARPVNRRWNNYPRAWSRAAEWRRFKKSKAPDARSFPPSGAEAHASP